MRTRLAAILLCVFTVPSMKAQAVKSAFFTTSDGVRIHYVEAGSGRAIVLFRAGRCRRGYGRSRWTSLRSAIT